MAFKIDLKGKRGVVLGVANEHSVAYGCAHALCSAGAKIVMTYQNEKAKRFVEPLVPQLADNVAALLPCDVTQPGQLEEIFAWVQNNWGSLDFIVHSIAFSKQEDLHGSVMNCSADGFGFAMDISCHSFLRMAKLAAPLMTEESGGVMLAMTYYGAEKVVENYNIMGPVKAALESSSRYLANDLAPKNIRVFCLSPGPLPTRAGSGIKDFTSLMTKAQTVSPMKRLVSISEVGNLATFLISDGSSGMTGQTIYVDGGYNIVG